VVALLSLALGCATTKIPTEELVDAQVSIRAAEDLGADNVPLASRHLQLAREEARDAQKHLERGERAEAARALERSSADAELAMALAKEAPLQEQAQEALRQAEALDR
jgi:hypothetical protein